MGVEQRRVRGGVEQGRAGQHLLVRGDGLPVRPRPGRLPGDGGPVADDGRVVAGLDGVVQDAREVGRRPGEQRGGDPRVAVEPDGDRQRLHHGPARQLVAERDGVRADLQHAERSASATGPRSGHSARSSAGSTCDGTTASCSTTSRAAGVSRCTRARTASTTVRGTGSSGEASASVTKNGLPAVARCSRCASTGEPAASSATASRGERIQRQPPHRAAAEAAEHALQRVLATDLVGPVGQQQQRGQVVDAPADVAQQVERGAVGPVHVLDGQDGRPVRVGQLLEAGNTAVVRGQRGGSGPRVPHRVAQADRARRGSAPQAAQRWRRPRRYGGNRG